MDIQNADQLAAKKCVPCEGGVEPCLVDFSKQQLNNLDGWYLTHENQRIRKDWTTNNFVQALDFFNKVGVVAEEEAHHPDLHLVDYKNVSIEIWTHAIGGLSENDFVLAAKIDQIAI